MDEKWEVRPQSDLDQLVERVAHGESVELTRQGKTVARIVAVAAEKPRNPPTWEELTQLRKRVAWPEGLTAKDLINEGRRM